MEFGKTLEVVNIDFPSKVSKLKITHVFLLLKKKKPSFSETGEH